MLKPKQVPQIILEGEKKTKNFPNFSKNFGGRRREAIWVLEWQQSTFFLRGGESYVSIWLDSGAWLFGHTLF